MKAENFIITTWSVIRNGAAVCDGRLLLKNTSENREAFLKELYKMLKCDYPKFYKMDDLSKLAFMTSEVLLKDTKMIDAGGEVALVFSNASASLDTDVHYFNSVADKSNYFPSPAVFVYTLPNIMVGEICIRNKFTGENAFFISEKFNAELLSSYAENILTSGKAKCVIAGWVEISDRDWEAALFLIENAPDKPGVNLSTAMKELYDSNWD
jgi:hypothetical protein